MGMHSIIHAHLFVGNAQKMLYETKEQYRKIKRKVKQRTVL
jgi:hypothetical protein